MRVLLADGILDVGVGLVVGVQQCLVGVLMGLVQGGLYLGLQLCLSDCAVGDRCGDLMSLLINGDDNHITRSRAGGNVLDQAADINVQGVVGGICQNQLDISAFGLAGGVGHNRARLNHHILRNVDSRANGNAILHELVDSSIVAGLLRLLHSVAGNLDVHSLILDALHHAVDLNGLQHVGLCASIFQSLNTSSNSVALSLSFLCELLQVLQAGQLFLIVCHIVRSSISLSGVIGGKYFTQHLAHFGIGRNINCGSAQSGEIASSVLDGVCRSNAICDHGENLTNVCGRVRLCIVLRLRQRRPDAGRVKSKSILTFHAQGELHVGVCLCGIVHSHVQFLPSQPSVTLRTAALP